MLPPWVLNMFSNRPCARCGAIFGDASIVCVGLRRPEASQAWRREPVIVVTVGCKQCGVAMQFSQRCTLHNALVAMVGFSEAIQKECEAAQPPLKVPGAGPAPTSESSGSNTRAKPSCRQDQPRAPISIDEQQRFLNSLRRVPFRPGNKGFIAWMRRMGIEVDVRKENRDGNG